jgi:hypothetical protein
MPKSKNRKEHKSKVQKRNNKIESQKKMIMKLRDEHLKRLINEQSNLGMYDNLPSIDPVETINIENLDGPII